MVFALVGLGVVCVALTVLAARGHIDATLPPSTAQAAVAAAKRRRAAAAAVARWEALATSSDSFAAQGGHIPADPTLPAQPSWRPVDGAGAAAGPVE
jgi:hypothetical protein